jgi:hypothetical protein
VKIHCAACGRYLGEIRDATLYKRIVFLCEQCHQKGDVFQWLKTGFKN